MPSYKKSFSYFLILWPLWMKSGWAADYAAAIKDVDVRQQQNRYLLNAHLQYSLSPSAKQAIQNGVALSWIVLIKVQTIKWWWPIKVSALEIPWVIRYHALLNQYSVKNLSDESLEVFSSLRAALSYMGSLKDVDLQLDASQAQQHDYQLSLKIDFDREFLPIPLRAESYFSGQWFLSSEWMQWPLLK